VDETISRIASKKGVHGVIILDAEGCIIKSTLTREMTLQYSNLLTKLIEQTRATVLDLDTEGNACLYSQNDGE
jgi:dynein light chain roadblock-type